jgi:hypothetical protein
MSNTRTKDPLAMTTDRDDIASLLERVKAATGPDREMDRSIWRHFNPLPAGRASDVVLPPGFGQGALNDALDPTPVLTASTDAALGLVERLMPGWRFAMYTDGEGKGPCCRAMRGDEPVKANCHASTLPLAILAALLTASTPSSAPAESGAVAEPVGVLNAQGGFLLTDSGASWLKGAIADTARADLLGQPVVAVFANPPAPSASMGRVTVKALDDAQIMDAIKEALPWKREPQLYDLLTYEKSPPLFPQATYDVPTVQATDFVRAIEKRLAALDSPPDHGGGEGEPAMSTELVERLRGGAAALREDRPYSADAMDKAADELTALTAKVALLSEALEWYGERARLARLIHSGGDPARFELSDDGGKRARRALSEPDKDKP